MKGTRILRYLGNRENPEENLFDPLEHYLRGFPYLLIGEGASAMLARLRGTVPDPLFSGFRWDGPGTLWHKLEGSISEFSYAAVVGRNSINTAPSDPIKNRIEQDEFETNLVEPLIGWRAWWLDETGMLRSLNNPDFVWPRERRAEAQCVEWNHVPPVEKCSCGFYAVDGKHRLEDFVVRDRDGIVLGLVYGWGRYVRGDEGFRSQYAYPRCFYLGDWPEGSKAVHLLRGYRVPIYVDQPVECYSPEEDGYHGYWTDEADGNLRTREEPDTREEAGSDEIPF